MMRGQPGASRMEVATTPPPEDLAVFGVAFEGPRGMRRSGGAVRFEVLARLEGIDAAEALQLVAHRRLRVGYRLHGGCSSSPAEHAGHAAVEKLDDATLRCRFVLPDAAFGATPLRLLHVGLLYEGLGSFEEWGQPGAWLAVSSGESDPFRQYFASFSAEEA